MQALPLQDRARECIRESLCEAFPWQPDRGVFGPWRWCETRGDRRRDGRRREHSLSLRGAGGMGRRWWREEGQVGAFPSSYCLFSPLPAALASLVSSTFTRNLFFFFFFFHSQQLVGLAAVIFLSREAVPTITRRALEPLAWHRAPMFLQLFLNRFFASFVYVPCKLYPTQKRTLYDCTNELMRLPRQHTQRGCLGTFSGLG